MSATLADFMRLAVERVAERRGVPFQPGEEPTGNLVMTIRDAILELNKVPKVSFMFISLRNGIDPEDMRRFPEFVAALDSHERIGSLRFFSVPFDDEAQGASPRSDDLERLFMSVLPNLPRLKLVGFYRCELHPRYVEHFFSGLPEGRRPLLELTLSKTHLPPGACQAIAGALRRGALADLKIIDPQLDPSSGALLLQAAAESPTLRVLDLAETCLPTTWTITADTWAGGGMARATVRALLVDASWTDAGMAELFRQLRVNVSLRVLDVTGSVTERRRFELLEELLTSYNFTIASLGRSVPTYWKRRRCIEALLRRNEQVRKVNGRLQTQNYCVGEPGLWPRVMGEVSAFPTLVYRFLRKGNVVALSDQLRQQSRGKRRSADS